MCNVVSTFIFDWILFILVGNKDSYISLDGFEIRKIDHGSMELAALECLKNLHRPIMGVML